MTNFQSFNSCNGWTMPGSGDFFVDDNGDLWVPCVCGRGDEDGTPPAAGSEPIPEPPQEADFEEADFVAIRIPEAGCVLADSGESQGWLYRGRHCGLVRLFMEGCEEIHPREEGCALQCGLCFYNCGDKDAVVELRRQGVSLQDCDSEMLRDFFDSEAEPPLTVAPGWARWLFLGRAHEDARPRFQHRRKCASRLRDPGEVEALLELAVSGRVTILLCFYRDFSGVDAKALAPACREEEYVVR